MCGIFGGSGKLDKDVLTSIGCQSESRGMDSSGLAWLDNLKQSILVSKVVERGSVAFPLLLEKEVHKASEASCMIGHTRMASTGKVSIKNAHPFFMDDIVFAHNGIITNYMKFGKAECDSVCLIKGIKDKNFEPFEGSVALVWIEKGKLNAYRKGNPLFRGRKNDGLYLASEKSILARVGCKKIKELTEGMIYTFNKTQIVQTVKIKENNVSYCIGTQEKWWKEYETHAFGVGFIPETHKEEDAEIKNLGLDYFMKDGKRYYGRMPSEEETQLEKEYHALAQINSSPGSNGRIHSMTDAEWERNGGV